MQVNNKLCRNREFNFAAPNPSEPDSLEARISAALWKWRFADIADRKQIIADSHLALMLEYWMPFSEIDYTRKLGTWCDGIPLLTVADIDRTAFAVTGVGYFPQTLSPFEIDFYYKHRRDLYTTKIHFRWSDGHVAGRSGLGSGKDPTIIHARRPTYIRHWTVAVELTPGETQ